jgi:penicillin-binding protein 1A
MPPRRPPSPRRPPPPRRRWPRILLRVALLLVLCLAAAAAAALHHLWPRCEAGECPQVESLRDYTPPQASRIYDADGVLLAHLAHEQRVVVSMDQIPRLVQDAFLAVEDKRFYQHPGVDVWRIAGAARRNVQSRRFGEGFSTITMQLARNVFPEQLTREKTLRRKVWEVIIAVRIEALFSKRAILEMYLNQIYLGEGYYGVQAAAQGYFGKPATNLTPAEAALLAALPKAPSLYSPHRNADIAVARRNLVLGLMAQQGRITEAAADEARRSPLVPRPPTESRGRAPYFVASVRAELRERYGPDAETAGLRIHTWLQADMQERAEAEIRAQIAAIEAGDLGAFRHRGCSEERPQACLQGLFVAMDAATGGVLALVGGRSFSISQFNRATQAQRQPGSAFKAVLYAAALANGVTLPTPLTGPHADEYEGEYQPADHVEKGTALDLRDGFKFSSNRAAVALGDRIGVDRVVRMSQDLGLTTRVPPFPSTFLGAAEVVPAEMVAAVAAFANGGVRVQPQLIRRIEDARGRTIYEAEQPRDRAVTPEVAFLTTELMRDVVESGTGTAVRRAGLPADVPVGGKTGTTNDATDVWFVGYTPEVAAGVWFGFDQPRRIMVGASAGKLAAPVFGRVLAAYYEGRPSPPAWSAPASLVSRRIDGSTGLLAAEACPAERPRVEWFIAGTEPLEGCSDQEPGDVASAHPFVPTPDWIEGRLRRLIRGDSVPQRP